MTKSIMVSSNCQTGGIAACMRALFPSYEIRAIPTPAPENETANTALREELKNSTIWVVGGWLAGGYTELAHGLPVKVMKLPSIWFDAFHPDLCYAQVKPSMGLTGYHYNSQIAVWAFNNQIAISDAVRLFNHSTFKALGYFDRWAHSIETLRGIFKLSDLGDREFDRFMLAVKRKGVFMYSVNHARAETLSELAKLLAIRLGASPSIVERQIVTHDGLSEHIWPLYPEIGQELGLEGNYCWRINGQEIDGLRAYLDFAYQKYSEQGIGPTELVARTPITGLDSILAAELKKL